MADQDLILLASENIEAYNTAKWERLRAVLADDVVYDEIGSRRRVQGAPKMVEAYQVWKQAFPDGAGNITKAVASGHAVTLEILWTGTHTGPLAVPGGGTILPSGKPWVVPGVQVIIFEGEKIKEFRQYFDLLTLLEQIGAAEKRQGS